MQISIQSAGEVPGDRLARDPDVQRPAAATRPQGGAATRRKRPTAPGRSPCQPGGPGAERSASDTACGRSRGRHQSTCG
jgi:hypothetical protein